MGGWGAGGDKDEQEGLRPPTRPTGGLDHPSRSCFKSLVCRLSCTKVLSTKRAGCLWSVPPMGDAHWGMSQGQVGPRGAGAEPRVRRWRGEERSVGRSLEMKEGSGGLGWKGPISPPSCPTSPFHGGGSVTQGREWKPAPKGSEVDSYLGNKGCSCSRRRTWGGTRSKAGRFCRGLLRSSCP